MPQSRDLGGCSARHVTFLVGFRLRAKSRPPSHPVQLAKRMNLIRQMSERATRWRRQGSGVQYALSGTAPSAYARNATPNTWHLVSRLRVQIASGLVAQQLSLMICVGLENGLVTPVTRAHWSAGRWRCSSGEKGACILRHTKPCRVPSNPSHACLAPGRPYREPHIVNNVITTRTACSTASRALDSGSLIMPVANLTLGNLPATPDVL